MARLVLVAVIAIAGTGLVAAQSFPSWAQPSQAGASSAPVYSDAIDPDAVLAPPSLPGPGPIQVPLDGGLGLLALAGGAYAVRRLRAS